MHTLTFLSRPLLQPTWTEGCGEKGGRGACRNLKERRPRSEKNSPETQNSHELRPGVASRGSQKCCGRPLCPLPCVAPRPAPGKFAPSSRHFLDLPTALNFYSNTTRRCLAHAVVVIRSGMFEWPTDCTVAANWNRWGHIVAEKEHELDRHPRQVQTGGRHIWDSDGTRSPASELQGAVATSCHPPSGHSVPSKIQKCPPSTIHLSRGKGPLARWAGWCVLSLG